MHCYQEGCVKIIVKTCNTLNYNQLNITTKIPLVLFSQENTNFTEHQEQFDRNVMLVVERSFRIKSRSYSL